MEMRVVANNNNNNNNNNNKNQCMPSIIKIYKTDLRDKFAFVKYSTSFQRSG